MCGRGTHMDRSTVPVPGAVTLPARPENLPLDPAATALLVVDMQNAYASLGGYLDLAGFDIGGAAAVVEKVALLVETARRSGVTVVFFRNGWDPDYVEAGGPGSPNWWKSNALKAMRERPDLKGKLLARGTWDYALVDRLTPEPGDIVIEKPRYSAFYNTALDSVLRARGVRTLAFCGIATNVCVESTLRDGYHREYFGVLIEDATHQAGPPFLQAATVYNVESFFGWVSSTAEFCGAVGQTPPPS